MHERGASSPQIHDLVDAFSAVEGTAIHTEDEIIACPAEEDIACIQNVVTVPTDGVMAPEATNHVLPDGGRPDEAVVAVGAADEIRVGEVAVRAEQALTATSRMQRAFASVAA